MVRVTDGRSSASGKNGPCAVKPEGGFSGGTAFISNPLVRLCDLFQFYSPYERRTRDRWHIIKARTLKVQSLKLYIEGNGGG